jgi:putative ABC transport system substrate-binding protein
MPIPPRRGSDGATIAVHRESNVCTCGKTGGHKRDRPSRSCRSFKDRHSNRRRAGEAGGPAPRGAAPTGPFTRELAAKRLELLHELLPDAKRIAVLVNPTNPDVTQNVIEQSQVAARRLGLEIVVLKAATEGDIEISVATAVQQRAAALSIGPDSYLLSRSRQIAFFALSHRLPTMGFTREQTGAGILMTYGTNVVDSYRQAGVYVGRILKGDKPASLPVMQPIKFELLINATIAKALGLQVPYKLLALADEVIQ